ncbi:MAG: polyprenyl synthetase family protein [Alphaproteobacteria bacterium]|nr:MAG: polyprenyl synthetase family protein [Alphaproteobacteria bacterium]
MAAPADPGFAAALTETAARVETALDALLPRPAGEDDALAEAMRHATLGGGKRLRAFLVMRGAALFEVPEERALRVAAATEMLHAYSLVHDDLPCMDDDDLRRGRPTVHVAWNEAVAVLVGDALQALAFEVLAAAPTHPRAEVRAALVEALARAAGASGMVGGQARDMAAGAARQPPDLAGIEALQAGKTGALIRFAACAGGLMGEAGPARIAALDAYAAALGLAFQIRDDVLDAAGDARLAGKRLGKDAASGKATFVSLMGLEAAQERAEALAAEAEAHLAEFGAAAEPLRSLARFTVRRDR